MLPDGFRAVRRWYSSTVQYRTAAQYTAVVPCSMWYKVPDLNLGHPRYILPPLSRYPPLSALDCRGESYLSRIDRRVFQG